MIGDNSYIYLNKKAPLEKINYSYSKFEGQHFLDKYVDNRNYVIEKIKNPKFNLNNPQFETSIIFWKWINSGTDQSKMDLIIKRFEVTRKIYTKYNEDLRPLDRLENFNQFECYLYFSYLLIIQYSRSNKLQYINSLLKVNDILISNRNSLNDEEISSLAYCLKEELKLIHHLKNSLND